MPRSSDYVRTTLSINSRESSTSKRSAPCRPQFASQPRHERHAANRSARPTRQCVGRRCTLSRIWSPTSARSLLSLARGVDRGSTHVSGKEVYPRARTLKCQTVRGASAANSSLISRTPVPGAGVPAVRARRRVAVLARWPDRVFSVCVLHAGSGDTAALVTLPLPRVSRRFNAVICQ